MRRQQRYDVYDTSRFFPNGAVVQIPPSHTIARTQILPASGVTSIAVSTGTASGSDVAEIPLTVDDHILAAGASHFSVSCAPCHGAAGFGGGTIAPNLVEKRPPSLRTGRVGAMPAGMLFHVVTDGVGFMPPYGWQLPPADRWAVIAYVRSLNTLPATAASRADSSVANDLRQLDSLRASHADLNTILRARRHSP
jgi:mono/diheme cytochrome c family protein